MKVIQCDICKTIIGYAEVNIASNFFDASSCIELCDDCFKIYKDAEASYLSERHELWEKEQSEIIKLNEKYKKRILESKEKHVENS